MVPETLPLCYLHQIIETNAFLFRLFLYADYQTQDLNEEFSYSKTVKVEINLSLGNNITVYPNPFNQVINIDFEAGTQGAAIIETMDIQGKIISSKQSNLETGNNIVVVSELEQMQAGIYFARITLNGETRIIKLVKN